MKKKLLSIVLVLSMLCAFMPVIASAATSGSCGANGDNVTWTLDDEGTLTISGEGDMWDYSSYYSCPWYNSQSSITKVVIEQGVTSIGSYAFRFCDGLTSVTIPDSVTNIGNYAFSYCSGLSSVNYNASKVFSNIFGESSYYYSNNILLIVLGDNVKSIDTNAFSDCDNLKRIIIPKSVTEIEKAAFKDCTSLSTVEYGGSKTDWNEIYIGMENENLEKANFVFNSSLSNTTLTDLDYLTYTANEDNTVTITNCYENATSINIPKEIDGKPVTSINASAFANRAKLTSVTIPESVTSIGERAFYGCGALTDIVIPSGVTTIESNTFYNCNKLKNVTIPKSVTAIKSYAFYGCDSLTDTYYSDSKTAFEKIKIEYGNNTLKESNIHYNSTAPTPTPTPTPKPTPTPAPTPLPVTTAGITKSETDTAYTFTVTPETAYDNCFVYAAVYDANGALIALNRVPLEMTGSTSVSVNKQENGVTAKVFVWSDFMQSIIEHAEEFNL